MFSDTNNIRADRKKRNSATTELPTAANKKINASKNFCETTFLGGRGGTLGMYKNQTFTFLFPIADLTVNRQECYKIHSVLLKTGTDTTAVGAMCTY